MTSALNKIVYPIIAAAFTSGAAQAATSQNINVSYEPIANQSTVNTRPDTRIPEHELVIDVSHGRVPSAVIKMMPLRATNATLSYVTVGERKDTLFSICELPPSPYLKQAFDNLGTTDVGPEKVALLSANINMAYKAYIDKSRELCHNMQPFPAP